MKTKIIKVDPNNPQEDKVRLAANTLIKGGLVVIPTDTVYGIAAHSANAAAIERLYSVKQRPREKPFALLIGDKEQAEEVASEISRPAFKLIDRFWPGPLTLILNSKSGSTVGLRMPDAPVQK